MSKKVNQPIINLFWTGGWDSTFRLLDLVINKKTYVQPYYIINTERKSIAIELKTMREIKDLVFREYPHTKELILPTFYKEVRDIKKDTAISKAFLAIKNERKIGTQFEWLALFCHEQEIDNMELCAGLTAGSGTALLIEPFVEEIEINSETVYRIKEEFFHQPVGILFRKFIFPLYNNFDKLIIKSISEKYDWTEIMNLTWFCHEPLLGKIPCGVCPPCNYVLMGNMEWRMPWYMKLSRSTGLYRVLRKVRNLNKEKSQKEVSLMEIGI